LTAPGEESSQFFFNPLRSWLLYVFVGTHLVLAFVLGEIFAFAPDEAGYLSNFTNLYKAGFNSSGLIGWTQTPIIFVRIIYAPASLVHLLGVPSYFSIRLLSIIASATALYLLMCIWRFGESGRKGTQKSLLIFAFIPSVFLWASLGLRESFIFLSLAMIGAGIFLLSQNLRKEAFVIEFLGLWLLLNVKNYLFVLVTFAILCQMTFRLIKERKVLRIDSYLLIAIALPLLIYPPGAKIVAQGVWSQLKGNVQSIVAPTPTPTPTPMPTSSTTSIGKKGTSSGSSGNATPTNNGKSVTPTSIDPQDPGQTLSSLAQELKRHPNTLLSKILDSVGVKKFVEKEATPTPSTVQSPTNSAAPTMGTSSPSARPKPSTSGSPSQTLLSPTATPSTSTIATVPPKGVVNVAAPHLRRTSRMNVEHAHLREPVSVVIRSGGFLFTPFPLIDNGSLFLDIMAFEAPFWWFVYLTFGVAVWRRFRKREFDELAFFSLIFVLVFLAFSALTEINVGTMIRHRSVLLIPIALLALPRAKKTANNR